MADDLAASLADAIGRAIGRYGPHSSWPLDRVNAALAEDLRSILSTELPAWYAGYEAGCREQAAARTCPNCDDAPIEACPATGRPCDDYSAPDYTPDERHRHTIGGQVWEHSHEGGHEAHSAVSHDLSGAALIGTPWVEPNDEYDDALELCECPSRGHEDGCEYADLEPDIIVAARGLRSESGENPEYDRALVELIRDTIGGEYGDIARSIDLRGDSFVQQVTR